MRRDQQVVWGIDLKAALRSVNAHFLKLPEAERDKGIMSFAGVPPPDNLIGDIWEKHLRRGLRNEPDPKLSLEAEAALVKKLTAFTGQPKLEADPARVEPEDMTSIKRKVHKRRGSWWQLPKDLQDVDGDKVT
jgi:hypothetical protein